ncbi:CaiB/BaiF CoA-transferase family protein [Arenicella sp. 4NH20-0111]|uniref:CaiB/BaiF CoA transferase family protein n=1 Tax=Arenicella sp. 4NH20-0111 TaxID=3127648 RepID=UPI0031086F76
MGPLNGVKVIELKGIGPGPYAGMLLADMGAEVIVVERARSPNGISFPASVDINCRGKSSIALNLKNEKGVETLLKLIESADMLLEGFRPGVAEKLGFGPEVCHQRNAKLVYGRVTGWGQYGPLSQVAGHDINYISLTGVLAATGESAKPTPPLNLVGDYAGGSLFLVMGMLAALHAAKETGVGDVIDAAITDGSANLMSVIHTSASIKAWQPNRSANMLDGGAHFYRTYETSDAKFVSVGSIEPQFYDLLLERAELDSSLFSDQHNPGKWREMGIELEQVFKAKTRDQWCEILEGTDVCFAPVLDYTEAPMHPHNKARETYIKLNGITQPAPAPKFSNNELSKPEAPRKEGQDTEVILQSVGFTDSEIQELIISGAVPPE